MSEKRMNLRLDDGLYARIAAAAAAEHRSINSFVSLLLDRTVPADPSQQTLFATETGAA